MWAIKFLKGPKAGQNIPLKNGEYKIGRAESCNIQLEGQGISKEHALLTVTESEVVIQDLNSRNGTFVNGVKTKTRVLKLGDRLSFRDIIIELVTAQASSSLKAPAISIPLAQVPQYSNEAFHGNAALNTMGPPQSGAVAQADQMQAQPAPDNFIDFLKHKFETLVLPEVLKLSQSFDYRWVIGSFVLLYVILVTGLSIVPMIRVTQSSIEQESQRRAMTIAQGLADRYKIALVNGTTGSFDTRFAEKEEGVTAAFILSATDGSIIAPVSRSGAYADEPFVHVARKKDEPLTQQIDSNTIGSSVPIPVYDQETGLLTPKAYAMVLYNMGSLAIDNGRIISLFSQILGIAILSGLILFIFLYRVIEAPVSSLAMQLDRALKDGHDKVESPYEYSSLQNLVLNINSALTRSRSPNSTNINLSKDIYSEATQLVRIISNPAFAIDRNHSIIAINSALATLLNITLTQIDSAPLSSLPDETISTIATELLQQVQTHTAGFISSPMHMNGRDFELNAQPVLSANGHDYIIFTIMVVGGEHE